MQLGRRAAHGWVSALVTLQLIAVFLVANLTHQADLIWVLASSGLAMLALNQYLKRNPFAGLPFFIVADLSLVLPALLLYGLPPF